MTEFNAWETPEDEEFEWSMANNAGLSISKYREIDDDIDDEPLFVIHDETTNEDLMLTLSELNDLSVMIEAIVENYPAAADEVEVFTYADVEDDDLDNLEKATGRICGSFIWSSSPQGHEFWEEVADALQVAQLRIEESHWDLPEELHDDVKGVEIFTAASDVLVNGFDWEASPEGHGFWARISNVLGVLGRGVPFERVDDERLDEDDQLDLFDTPIEYSDQVTDKGEFWVD